MRHATRFSVRPLAVAGSLFAVSFAGDCFGRSQDCDYTTNNFPPTSSVNVANPAHCPIKTPPGGRSQAYVTTIYVPSGTTTGGGNLAFYDNNGNGVTQSQYVTYTPASGPGYFDGYLLTGSYFAGGVAVSGGHDLAVNQIVRTNNSVASANVNITYQTGAAAAVLGDVSAEPGYSVPLAGEYYQSDLVPPISYQWYENGSPLPGGTSPTITAYAPVNPNSGNTYEFRVTDSQSQSVSAIHTLWSTGGCGPYEETCGRASRAKTSATTR